MNGLSLRWGVGSYVVVVSCAKPFLLKFVEERIGDIVACSPCVSIYTPREMFCPFSEEGRRMSRIGMLQLQLLGDFWGRGIEGKVYLLLNILFQAATLSKLNLKE